MLELAETVKEVGFLFCLLSHRFPLFENHRLTRATSYKRVVVVALLCTEISFYRTFFAQKQFILQAFCVQTSHRGA